MSNLQGKLEDGLSTIQGGLEQGKAKLQVTQEVLKQKKIVKSTTEAKAKLLIELSLSTYQKIRAGVIKDEELADIAGRVKDSDQVIYKALCAIEELTQKDDIKLCECGTKLKKADLFCGSCGSKVQTQELAAQEKVSCTNCEEMMPKGSNFCGCCGTKFECKGA